MNSEYDTLYQDALACALGGDTEQAIEALRQCLRLRPDRPEPLLDLLSIYRGQGQGAEQAEAVTELLANWPTDPAVRLAAAEYRLAEGDRPGAAWLLADLSLDPESMEFPNLLDLLLQLDEAERALALAVSARRSSLWSQRARLAEAVALSRLNRHAEALALFQSLADSDFGMADQPDRQGLLPAWREALRRAGQGRHNPGPEPV